MYLDTLNGIDKVGKSSCVPYRNDRHKWEDVPNCYC